MNLIRRLEALWGESTKSGDEYRFECPKCSEFVGKNHLWVNLGKAVYHCFRCGYQGSLFSVVGRGVFTPHPRTVVKKEYQVTRTGIYPVGFVRIRSMSGVVAEEIYSYMKARYITRTRCAEIGIGYVEGNIKLANYAIMPITEFGREVYWVARTFRGSNPKEISPTNEQVIYPRRELVYGLDEVQAGREVWVVEGIFDAERLRATCGVTTVAILGSNVSDHQIGKILAAKPSHIHALFDGDVAGRKAASTLYAKIVGRSRCKVTYHRLPEGEDPGSVDQGVLYTLTRHRVPCYNVS